MPAVFTFIGRGLQVVCQKRHLYTKHWVCLLVLTIKMNNLSLFSLHSKKMFRIETFCSSLSNLSFRRYYMWDIWEQTMTFYDRPEWRVQSSVLHNFIVIQLIYLWCVEVWALFTTLSDINYKHLYEGLKACCPPRPVVLFWYLNAGSRIFRRK